MRGRGLQYSVCLSVGRSVGLSLRAIFTSTDSNIETTSFTTTIRGMVMQNVDLFGSIQLKSVPTKKQAWKDKDGAIFDKKSGGHTVVSNVRTTAPVCRK